jgi:uncharacterized membrane protein YphA (DoxX/SURF4 family)
MAMNRISALIPHSILFFRLIVGIIFILSSISKLPHHSLFVAIVQSYRLLPDPLAMAYALALPWVELVLGAYLIFGILVRPSAIVTILTGISFLVANVSAIIRGELHCGGCFGETIPLLVSQALALDIFILIVACLLLIHPGGKQLLSFDNWFARRQKGKPVNSNNVGRNKNHK